MLKDHRSLDPSDGSSYEAAALVAVFGCQVPVLKWTGQSLCVVQILLDICAPGLGAAEGP